MYVPRSSWIEKLSPPVISVRSSRAMLPKRLPRSSRLPALAFYPVVCPPYKCNRIIYSTLLRFVFPRVRTSIFSAACPPPCLDPGGPCYRRTPRSARGYARTPWRDRLDPMFTYGARSIVLSAHHSLVRAALRTSTLLDPFERVARSPCSIDPGVFPGFTHDPLYGRWGCMARSGRGSACTHGGIDSTPCSHTAHDR